MVRVRLKGGEQIEATPEHPFYVKGKGFVAAKWLRAGLLLSTLGGTVPVEAASPLSGLAFNRPSQRRYRFCKGDFKRMNIQRDAALILLSTLKAAQLNSSEKEEILDEYRFSNYDTPQFCKENYKELLQNLEISKGGSSEFTGLFIDHFQPQFKGISNAYLSMLLQNFGIYNLVVVGDEDGVQACPCCGFKTIENLGHYEICPVCNWEDDGSGDLNRFSAANRGTLKEYRERIKENLEGENLKVVELKYGKSPLF